MITVGCPNCAKQYQIPDTALGDKGRTMQCKSCGEKWFCTTEHIIAPEPVMAAAAAPESAPPESDPWEGDTPAALQEKTHELVKTTIANAIAEPMSSQNTVATIQRGATNAQMDAGGEADAEELLKAQRAKRRIDFIKIYLTPQWICSVSAGIIVLLFLSFPYFFLHISTSYAKIYEVLGYSINMEGLLIDNINARYETQKGTQIMFIDGEVTNLSTEIKTLPRLKIYMKTSASADVYSWVVSPPKLSLLPGEAVKFKARYADPAPEVKQLHIKFFTGAGARK